METAAVKKTRAPLLQRTGGNGLAVLFRKELADHIRSKRILIILVLVAVIAIASVYGALAGIQDAIESEGDEGVFLKLFTASGNSIPSFASFIALLGPLIGLTMGFDAINGERSRGTLNRLVAQPIYRDAVINGKFLAGVTVITIMTFTLGILISGLGLIGIGVPPSFEEIIRLFVFLLFTAVYISFWLGISILFSILLKHAATSALAVIAIWLFFALFVGLLSGIIANALYPIVEGATTTEAATNNALAQLNISRISPSQLYSEAVTTILNPQVRVLGLVTQEALSGAITGPLPVGQSILLVWPHLIGMLALTMISFAISYICFMRQEVRGT